MFYIRFLLIILFSLNFSTNLYSNWWDQVSSWGKERGQDIKGAADTVKDKTGKTAQKVSEKAKEGFKTVKEKTDQAGQKIKETGQKVGEKTKEGFEKAKEKTEEKIEDIKNIKIKQKGYVHFKSKIDDKILKIKFEESRTGKNRGWFTVKPRRSFRVKTEANVAAPDVKDLWVEVYDKNSGRFEGEFYWSENINIKNNKITTVNFEWKKNLGIPLRREVSEPGNSSKIIEGYSRHKADKVGIYFYNNTSNYYLVINYRFFGQDDWNYFSITPYDFHHVHSFGKDIGDMVVSIFDNDTFSPIDVVVWNSNVSVKRDKETHIYFKKSKRESHLNLRLDKIFLLGRKVKVGNKIKEKYYEKYGAITKLGEAQTILKSIVRGNFKRNNLGIDLEPWRIPDKNLRLDQVCFLASHNAFSNYQSGYSFYYQQYYDLKKQFDMGVRCFLLDCWPVKAGTNNEGVNKSYRPVVPKLCHGEPFLNPALRIEGKINIKKLISAGIKVKNKKSGGKPPMPCIDGLRILKNLLEKNPDEIIFIELENYIDKETTDKMIEDSGISDLTLTPEDWNLDENGGMWPTLDALRISNKRVVFWANNGPTKYTFNQWQMQRSNSYGSIVRKGGALKLRGEVKKYLERQLDRIKKLAKEKSNKEDIKHEKKLLKKKYLEAINFFPGDTLENAGKYLSKGMSKIKDVQDFSAALDDLILALKLVKLYFDIDYKKLNGNKFEILLNEILSNGLEYKNLLAGQMPNFLNLDQVNQDNSMRFVNYFNDFAKRKLANPNLILLNMGEEISTKNNEELKGMNLSGRRFDVEDFSNSDLSGAKLKNCFFVGCKFDGTKTNRLTDLRGSVFIDIDFTKANLNLTFNYLKDVIFIDCIFGKVTFGNRVVDNIKDFPKRVLDRVSLLYSY
ncbi:hypothetical protein GF385_00270 [Candidatus Dependentiae bacterium]|nr:hypothetical protein [Candidatus Dependentiae bacterium]